MVGEVKPGAVKPPEKTEGSAPAFDPPAGKEPPAPPAKPADPEPPADPATGKYPATPAAPAKPADPKRSVSGTPALDDKGLDLLRQKIMEHMQSYEKPDLSAEVADEAFLLKLFARYEDSGDGKNFKMANGSAYSIKPGLVSGPDFDGTNIGGPAHVANVMELMLVAKGSFEKDSGYFNTPYEKELPIAGYIAKLQGFELKNVTPEMIAGLDPKVKAEIDKQWAAKQKELGIEVEPDRSVTKDQKFDSPADAGSALATRLEDISQEIDGKFGAGENLPQDKAHSDFVADLHDRIRTGDTVGINKVIADFERDYGAQVPKEQQAEFKTAMDALKTEVAEFAAKNKLDLEPKKSEPAPVTPTPTPAPVPPPTVP